MKIEPSKIVKHYSPCEKNDLRFVSEFVHIKVLKRRNYVVKRQAKKLCCMDFAREQLRNCGLKDYASRIIDSN